MARQLWQSRIIAIDPGDAHCGVATFTGGTCTSAQETNPDECLHLVQQAVESGMVDLLVVENWRLYPDKAAEQAGSEMLTSQCIGAIKWIVRKHNELVVGLAEANNGELFEVGGVVELVMQDASIKKPTTTMVKHEGIKPVSRKTPGDHERDAEIHGWHFILRGQGKIRGSEQNKESA